MPFTVRPNDALLIVDPQIDFCPGGALPVPNGDAIFPHVNRASALVPVVAASRDWHPPDHISFKEQGGPWPPHCVQNTRGAEFHPALDLRRIQHVVSKATRVDEEAYSAFQGTDLEDWLKERGVERIFVAGLATDYCVRQSVLDARQAGFDVVVLEDSIGAVELKPGDGERALAEMKDAGARMVTAEELMAGAEQLNMDAFRLSKALETLELSVPEAGPFARRLLRVVGRVIIDTGSEGADPAVWANTESMALQWLNEALLPLGYEVAPTKEGGRPQVAKPSTDW
jgi:nicotinamidase/pyrazinamidase